jgi:ubiquinone/menaquinone biosynthesis C-methylase UbiE
VPRRDRRSASCGQTRNSFPLRDETVDAVVSIAVLELVPDPAAALAEMARLLRPGGRLTVIVGCGGHARPSPTETDITHRGWYQMRRSKT